MFFHLSHGGIQELEAIAITCIGLEDVWIFAFGYIEFRSES